MKVLTAVRQVMTGLMCAAIWSCGAIAAGSLPASSSTLNPAPEQTIRANSLPQNPRPSKPIPPLSSVSAVVMDGLTGEILAAKNPHERRAVASTQKLLTALTVLDDDHSEGLRASVVIEAVDTRVEPSKIYIRPGETYTRQALLKALIVKSGNDVAKALARDVAGSEEQFVDLMNAKALSLGMRNSHFMNAHGLTEEGQFSTAMDIALLSLAAYQSPILRGFMKERRYPFIRPNGQSLWLSNTNQLLSRIPYCTGMKTGTTKASGRCLVSSGELNGRLAIVVVLGASSERVLYDESEALMRWALER